MVAPVRSPGATVVNSRDTVLADRLDRSRTLQIHAGPEPEQEDADEGQENRRHEEDNADDAEGGSPQGKFVPHTVVTQDCAAPGAAVHRAPLGEQARFL